ATVPRSRKFAMGPRIEIVGTRDRTGRARRCGSAWRYAKISGRLRIVCGKADTPARYPSRPLGVALRCESARRRSLNILRPARRAVGTGGGGMLLSLQPPNP